MKCHVPAKNESKTWTKYIPTNCRSCLDWYFCDHKSVDYPLRDVSGQGKPEPHYEDGTFNACTSCNQRYLKKALENGERYIFFFTKYVGRDKDLKEKYKFAKENGLLLSTDFEETLNDDNIDAIVLATPHSHHENQIINSAKLENMFFAKSL